MTPPPPAFGGRDGVGVRERAGRFAEWSTADLAAQCRMEAREQLDPEFTEFMHALAERLAGFAASKRDGAPATDWQLAYAIEWANRSVESVKARMWQCEDVLRALAEHADAMEAEHPDYHGIGDQPGPIRSAPLNDALEVLHPAPPTPQPGDGDE